VGVKHLSCRGNVSCKADGGVPHDGDSVAVLDQTGSHTPCQPDPSTLPPWAGATWGVVVGMESLHW
jgi:hypothetical protein